jgi:hypothetical protein
MTKIDPKKEQPKYGKMILQQRSIYYFPILREGLSSPTKIKINLDSYKKLFLYVIYQ